MEDKKKKALSYFNNHFNCAQSVFTTFGTELGIDEDLCLKISCALGAGMGRQQHVCGAVSGALMALGLKFGKALHDPEEKKEDSYRKAARFLELFSSKNESIYCKKLLKDLNMNDEKDLKKINELGLFEKNCEQYIQDAIEITEMIFKVE